MHERIWMRLAFGTEEIREGNELIVRDKHYKSVIKGISWRIIGSLDTFWIAIFVTHQTNTSFLIAGTEVITKVGLFWLHERLWMKVKWGAKPDQVLQTGQ